MAGICVNELGNTFEPHLSLGVAAALADSLTAISLKTLSQRHPAKLCPQSWPTEIVG